MADVKSKLHVAADTELAIHIPTARVASVAQEAGKPTSRQATSHG